MTPCPWCGIESLEENCPWCKRSKHGERSTSDSAVSFRRLDRAKEAMSILGALVVVASLVAVVLIGLPRPHGELSARGTPPAMVASLGTVTPVAYPLPSGARQPITRGDSPWVERTPARPKRTSMTRLAKALAGAVEIRVSDAALSVYDDGSGLPTLMGSVAIENLCGAEISALDIRLEIGERHYRMEPLTSVRIAPGARSIVALRSYTSVPKSDGTERRIVVQARVGDPPALAIDSSRVP